MFIFLGARGLVELLLIGFWYERPNAADAAKKAFITNRLGDFGFLIGIILIWSLLETLKFDQMQTRLIKTPARLARRPAWRVC